MLAVVEYRVGLAERARHLFQVEARFPVEAAALTEDGSLELRLAVWTPGSYLVREYERHLQDLSVEDGEGRPLPARKVAKARWRVEPAQGLSVVVARYRVYAHEVTV